MCDDLLVSEWHYVSYHDISMYGPPQSETNYKKATNVIFRPQSCWEWRHTQIILTNMSINLTMRYYWSCHYRMTAFVHDQTHYCWLRAFIQHGNAINDILNAGKKIDMINKTLYGTQQYCLSRLWWHLVDQDKYLLKSGYVMKEPVFGGKRQYITLHIN